DGTELPDAIGRQLGSGTRKQREALRAGAFLGEDLLPELVLVGPGVDDQKIELGAAAMKDDEAQVAAQRQRTALRRLKQMSARRRGDIVLDRSLAQRDVVPLQAHAAERQRTLRSDELVAMDIRVGDTRREMNGHARLQLLN